MLEFNESMSRQIMPVRSLSHTIMLHRIKLMGFAAALTIYGL